MNTATTMTTERGATFLTPEWPLPESVRALQTTRLGGASCGRWRGFNLGDHVGDAPASVAANRAALARHLPAAPAWLQQEHGIGVAALDQGGSTRADAALTRQPGRVCAVLSADCLPLLLAAEDASAVAAAHAGWRGLAAGVIETTLAAFGLPPARISVWLGPAIGPTAFVVGDEVRRAFMQHDSRAAAAFCRQGERWTADLYRLARQRLSAAGVRRIYGGGECTFSDQVRYFSHRRDGTCGRMASLIWREPA